MPTIGDVARKAGVSRTAVSFAFNDPSRIAKGTHERILAIADELGYYPNPIARSLTGKHVGVLGLLIPQRTAKLFANPFFADLLRGIGHICDRHDYSVLLVPPMQGSLTYALRRAVVDGFVVVGLDEDHPAISMLLRRKLPFVTIDGPALPGISAVNIDEEDGASQAARHLLELGHRDVLTVVIRPAQGENYGDAVHPLSSVAARRLSGYRTAFEQAGVPFPEDLVIPADSTHEGGFQALRTVWLAGGRPTAVLAMSDIMALGTIDAARSLDLSVPNHISVVGFDDCQLAQWTRPPLTTVRQPGLDKGMRAARLLIENQIGNEAFEHQVLPATLIVRGTTAPPPSNLLKTTHPI